MKVVALTGDLLDRSRLAAGAGPEAELSFARGGDEVDAALAGGAVDVVIVDLARPEALRVIEAAVAAGVGALAYGAHVDDAALGAAAAAGARALPRSRFFRAMGELLSEGSVEGDAPPA